MTALWIQSLSPVSAEGRMLAPVWEHLAQQGEVRFLPGARSRWWPFGQGRAWVLGREAPGPRHGTILLAPDQAAVAAFRERWPAAALVVGESLDRALAGDAAVTALPRLIPAAFFPPGTGADPFGVTGKLHLEARPRLVAFCEYANGAAMTRLLALTEALLTRQGEMVFLDGIGHRAALAPVVKGLRLADRVVFAPPLATAELAGLFVGADLFLVPGSGVPYAAEITWAMASGIPIVAQHSPANEALLGDAALWVYESSVDTWVAAVQEVLTSARVREALARRQLNVARPWRSSVALQAWVDFFESGDRGSRNH